jgi:hypothetical protein
MCQHCLNRREFHGLAAAGVAAGMAGLSASLHAAEQTPEPWDPDKPLVVTGKPLRVQPILMHARYAPREKTSWRSWSSIINEPAAAEEMKRIQGELDALAKRAPFPLQLLPLAKVTAPNQGAALQQGDFDVVLLFAATGGGDLFRACAAKQPERDTILFVRHKSGPTYYWYECFGTRAAKVPTPESIRENSVRNHGGVTIDDCVVDDYGEVLWRLQALYGLKNFVGQRIVAVGGAGGKWDSRAPAVARERFLLDIAEVSYAQLAPRLKAALADPQRLALAQQWTDRYLALPNTRLETKKEYVRNAVVLYMVFKDLMREHRAPAMTINACMGTIMPMADSTACLTLSWLNDEGLLAFCESDFVIIPCGIFLHYIAGLPVFLHNSTFPHKGIVTCAHCTGPRRMDGKRYEPVRIMTHYESDFGAAPKVEMPIGQPVTFVDPEYTTGRWLGMKGIVRDNPCFDICRSQQDVEICGQWKKLLAEARDSHWMMAYGDHLQKLGYAARKIGIQWIDLSEGV